MSTNSTHQQMKQHRRLSNVSPPAPPTITSAEGNNNRPTVRAGPSSLGSDVSSSSEDEIESLKRDMGSDSWALQRQRLKRQQHHQQQSISVAMATISKPKTAAHYQHYPEYSGQDWTYTYPETSVVYYPQRPSHDDGGSRRQSKEFMVAGNGNGGGGPWESSSIGSTNEQVTDMSEYSQRPSTQRSYNNNPFISVAPKQQQLQEVAVSVSGSPPMEEKKITIQSLLNSPTPSEAIHIPMPPPNINFNNQNSSPNSRSSYHSANHSAWTALGGGRAETINQEFATAQQSLSSLNDNDGGIESEPAMSQQAVSTTSSKSFGFDYYSHRPGGGAWSKPVSVMAQHGDDGNDDDDDDNDMAAMSQQLPTVPDGEESMGHAIDEALVRMPIDRKPTGGSLDNVLEYYRSPTSPSFDHTFSNKSSNSNLKESASHHPSEPLAAPDSSKSIMNLRSSFSSPANKFQNGIPRQPVMENKYASITTIPPLSEEAGNFEPHTPSAAVQPPPSHSDIFRRIEEIGLAEPDEFTLLPSAHAEAEELKEKQEEPIEDCVLQMESIDGFSELSDSPMVEDSYSSSSSSNSSFGDPIEHSSSMLLGNTSNVDRDVNMAISRLQMTDTSATTTSVQPPLLNSGRTNASTLIPQPPPKTATAATAATNTKQTKATLPLEILDLASELEICLAREQEDYYSDNVAPANLNPLILQNLGKTIRQQLNLQRKQNLQRKKSNMNLGISTPGVATAGTTVAPIAIEEEEDESTEYEDYEQALKTMLLDVSQYFTQSGLNLIFPFSAKWVDWLTRHPDRPFPWRKNEDDDDDDDDDDDSNNEEGNDKSSEVSSFGGGEPPVLSHPLPAEDVLSKATIPMSMRRPTLVKDYFVSHQKRRGINAHWQYYSVINQITAVASNIHRQLGEGHGRSVAHQLAALYQFMGGDFKKYKTSIEAIFGKVKQGANKKEAKELRDLMAKIIADALYTVTSTSTTNTSSSGTDEGGRVLATLRGLPTQPIVKYLGKEMRVMNETQQRRGRLAHNLSRNNSNSHLLHQQYLHQEPHPPVPPLPVAAANKEQLQHEYILN